MSQKDLVILGKLGAPYGIKGWLKISSYTDNPDDIFEYSPWLLKINDELKTVNVVDWRRHNKGLVAKLDCADDRDVAHELTNTEIAVNVDELPELPEDEFYWRDLMGMRVCTNKGYDLGKVDDLLETGSNDVLVVKANSNDGFGKHERLIPFIEEQVILEVDQSNRQITVDWDPSF